VPPRSLSHGSLFASMAPPGSSEEPLSTCVVRGSSSGAAGRDLRMASHGLLPKFDGPPRAVQFAQAIASGLRPLVRGVAPVRIQASAMRGVGTWGKWSSSG
jgi:hypothetical protein